MYNQEIDKIIDDFVHNLSDYIAVSSRNNPVDTIAGDYELGLTYSGARFLRTEIEYLIYKKLKGVSNK